MRLRPRAEAASWGRGDGRSNNVMQRRARIEGRLRGWRTSSARSGAWSASGSTWQRIGSPEASLIDELGADALAVVELTLVFEETFDIEIPDEEADKIRTVRDAVAAVESHIPARPPG